MKKTIVQYFNAPLDVVLKAREARWDEKEKIPDLKSAEEVERREDDSVIYIERESSASSFIPPRFRKYVSPDMLKWREHSTWHKARNFHEWRVTPEHYANVIEVHGSTKYEQLEDKGAPRTRRTLEMNFKVKVPLLGPIAETMVFEAFKKNFEKDHEAIAGRIKNLT